MAALYHLPPGEARTLQFHSGLRYLVHRPGRRALYLVYAEDQLHHRISPIGTFTTWAAAIAAVRSRHLPGASAG